MIGRSVEMWRGKTPDSPIPPRVRLRVFERFGGVCQLTGRKIQVGDEWQVDHRLALTLGGENAEENLWPVLATAHKAKTREDVGMKAKAQRIKLKHLGQWPKSKRPLKSRGFERSRANPTDEGRRENTNTTNTSKEGRGA